MEKPFEHLLVWRDPLPRSGPENMAVDEVLLDGLGAEPVLRIYGWQGDWVSLGYFQRLAEAQGLFDGDSLGFVRRMTGGGVVDHRDDLTYSLIVPRGGALAEARGEDRYRRIHAAVVEALLRQGTEARMLIEDDAGQSAACFQRAVAWDVVGTDGRKLAGAGQKRSRRGLLHQGSVLGGVGEELGDCLSGGCRDWEPAAGALDRAEELGRQKYGSPDWLGRR